MKGMTAIARWRASSPREPASAVLTSLMQLRQEIEHRRDDDIDRYELDALEPIGMSVPAYNRADEYADEERAHFRAAEWKFQRLRRNQ